MQLGSRTATVISVIILCDLLVLLAKLSEGSYCPVTNGIHRIGWDLNDLTNRVCSSFEMLCISWSCCQTLGARTAKQNKAKKKRERERKKKKKEKENKTKERKRKKKRDRKTERKKEKKEKKRKERKKDRNSLTTTAHRRHQRAQQRSARSGVPVTGGR